MAVFDKTESLSLNAHNPFCKWKEVWMVWS